MSGAMTHTRSLRGSELRGWPRAKALGDIGRQLAATHNDGGQIVAIFYDWQAELLADEMRRFEEAGAMRLEAAVLGTSSCGALAFWSAP